MIRNKAIYTLFISILFFFKISVAFAQAPNITYASPQNYTVNTTISPLQPSNSGGAVPATVYGQVSTFAGGRAPVTYDGTGTNAGFNLPSGAATDGAGNVYISDFGSGAIRKITPAAVVTTIANVATPSGLILDNQGNIFVTNFQDNQIYKISTNGAISVFAGNGLPGSTDGIAAAASFNGPGGIVIDALGNLFLADQQNNKIREISPAGVVTTFAGNGTAGANDGIGPAASFNNPDGIAVDKQGNVYVADTKNNLIRKISPTGNVITFAGNGSPGITDGTGISASFNYPTSIAIDASGNLYVTDYKNNLIRKITTAGVVTSLAGNGTTGNVNGLGTLASFNGPLGSAIDIYGQMYVTDEVNYLVRKIILTGYTINKPLPTGLTFDPTTGIISGTPTAASPATDYTVTAYDAGGSNSTIVNIDVENSTPAIPPPLISYKSPQTYTQNIAIAPLSPTNTGGSVPAVAYGQVSTFAGNKVAGSANGTGITASFHSPIGAAIDAAGNIYVGDDVNSLVRKITPAGVVTTLAGNGKQGYMDGNGTSASFDAPFGVAVDGAGNVYVADEGNNMIRKIDPAGNVTTFAGSGTIGSGDGIAAVATFNHPYAVAVDGSGNVYVADGANNLIRKITATGVVTTLAGNGSIGSADGNGIAASFRDPEGIAVDAAGNVYVSDSANNLIRKITPGGTVTTIAGSGVTGSANGTGNAASFNYPFGLTVDGIGNIYVVDQLSNIIRKITPAGIVTTFVGSGIVGSADGIGTAAGFNTPADITIDAFGNLYLADGYNNEIRKITTTGYTIDKSLPPGLTFDPTTGIISGTPAAASPATNYTVTAYNTGGSSSAVINITVKPVTAAIVNPPNISYQTPQIYTTNTAIAPLTPTNTGGAVPATIYGQVSTFAGSGAAGAANGISTVASFNSPVSTAVDASGNVYVTDQANYLIRKITPSGNVSTLAGSGSPGYANGTGTAASFNTPSGITIGAGGNLYLADEINNVIREITPLGVVSTFAGINNRPGFSNGTVSTASFSLPFDVAMDGSGNMYVADEYYNLVRKITPGGIVSTLAGSGSAGSANGNGPAASFNGLLGIAVDVAGNIYVSDSGNNLVRKITPVGNVSTFAGSGANGLANGNGTAASFYGPVGIAVDVIGNIYVADDGNDLIRVIDPSGNVTTLAGSTVGYLDGTGSMAMFNNPAGLSMDASRNLYVADQVDNHIRKVITTGYKISTPLPPGLTFDATTGTISGSPTTASPATDYTITAYNLGGSSATTVNITVILAATITFGPIPPKTVCDADFDPGATVVTPITTLNPPITYTSSNTAVATIVAGKIHITGAGTSIITASEGALSAVQTLTVSAAVVPTVTISPVAIDTCQGSAVTYTATITNGGTNPVYQWQVNGQNSGTNSTQFTSGNLNDNDKITCILTSNALCTTNATVTSNVAVFNIYTQVPTSVTIISTASGPICAGTEVDFIATASTPDNNPAYQWQVNSINVGTNSQTFGSTSLGEGDVVTCILISNAKCLINPDALSNAITISLSPASACIISIPNTFTPNGDGINDLWNITALQGYPTCTVNIYNRYGTLVYNSIGYPKAWDGNYNGSALPVGTYYYIIDLKNGKKKLAGPITILR